MNNRKIGWVQPRFKLYPFFYSGISKELQVIVTIYHYFILGKKVPNYHSQCITNVPEGHLFHHDRGMNSEDTATEGKCLGKNVSFSQ